MIDDLLVTLIINYPVDFYSKTVICGFHRFMTFSYKNIGCVIKILEKNKTS